MNIHLISVLAGVVAGVAAACLVLLGDFRWVACIALVLAVAVLLRMARETRKRKSTNSLREAVQSLPMPIAIYDANEKLVAFNSHYMSHHPEAFAQVDLQNPENFPTYRELVLASIDHALPDEERQRQLQVFLDAQPPDDGLLRERKFPRFGWLRIGKKRLPSGGNVRVAIDVNELKDREADLLAAIDRAEAADAAKTDFLARMSHELRTPLNGIIGMANLLLASQLGRREEKNAQMILSSGLHLLDLINDILDHAKFQSAVSGAEQEAFDIEAVTEDVLNEARASKHAAGLEISASFEPGFRSNRLGAPRALRQVLTNLVGNAIKFTDQGSVKVAFSETGTGIRFAVTDTGIGIPEAERCKIFQAFQQADSSLTRRYGGTGLGLTITLDILSALGGNIAVAGAEDGGSVFTVEMPLAIAAEAAA
ncbi:MAG: ATP-binding protein [Pseudomonadota bacterium]